MLTKFAAAEIEMPKKEKKNKKKVKQILIIDERWH